jgi:hypothetical protein
MKEFPMSRKLMLFLIANFVLALFVILNLFYKNSHEGKSFFAPEKENTPMIVSPVTQLNNAVQIGKVLQPPVLPTQPTVRTPIVIQPPSIAQTPVIQKQAPVGSCVVYGPVPLDSKNTLDLLFNKAQVLNSAQIFNKPVYEIVWNLGHNKVTAIELFEHQKNGGPLQDSKFKLTSDKNGDWIVPIAEITADEQKAAIATKELGEKAQQSNTGGKWQYRAKTDIYFYQFKNNAIIPLDVQGVLDKTFAIPKAGC